MISPSSSMASSAAGDVGERGLRHVLADQLGLGLGELHDASAAALDLVHQEDEEHHDQDEREQRDQELAEEARLGDLDVVVLDRAVLSRPPGRPAHEVALLAEDPGGGDLLAVCRGRPGSVWSPSTNVTVLTSPSGDVGAHRGGVDLVVPAVGRRGTGGRAERRPRRRRSRPRAHEDALNVHVRRAWCPDLLTGPTGTSTRRYTAVPQRSETAVPTFLAIVRRRSDDCTSPGSGSRSRRAGRACRCERRLR